MNMNRLARRAAAAVAAAGVLALAACTSSPADSGSGSGAGGELTTLKVATIGLVSDAGLRPCYCE